MDFSVSGTSGASTMKIFQDAVRLVSSMAKDLMGGAQAQGPAQGVQANQQAAAQQVNPSGAPAQPQGGNAVLQQVVQVLQMIMQMLQQGQDGGAPPAQPASPPCAPAAQQVAGQLPVPAASAATPAPADAARPDHVVHMTDAGPVTASTTPPGGAAPAAAPTGGSSIGPAMVGPAGGIYDPDIERYAKEYGLDPNIVKCQIAKESQGNPNAESPVGAVGVGQIKPETASELAGRPVSAEELKRDTRLNIELTCRYDAQIKAKFGGSDEAMLAGYNQGPYADNPLQNSEEAQDYVHAIMTGAKAGQLPSWG